MTAIEIRPKRAPFLGENLPSGAKRAQKAKIAILDLGLWRETTAPSIEAPIGPAPARRGLTPGKLNHGPNEFSH